MSDFGPIGISPGGEPPKLNMVTDAARRGKLPLDSKGWGPDGEPDLTPERPTAKWWRTSVVAKVIKIAIPVALAVAAIWILATWK